MSAHPVPSQTPTLKAQQDLRDRVAGNLSLLCALGSADRIASYLSRKGFRGLRGRQSSCAIAVYLHDRAELQVCVRRDAVVFSGPAGEVRLANPGQLSAFISKFDRGDYPELDAEAEAGAASPSFWPDSAA